MNGRRGRTRSLAVAALALVAVVYVANLPLYAGASFEGWSWRMEHGRVTIRRNPYLQPKPFWTDGNSEGLRWSAQWRAGGRPVEPDDPALDPARSLRRLARGELAAGYG